MTWKQFFTLAAMLLGVTLAQPRFGGDRNNHRLLESWTFDEPCIAGPILYENPAEGTSLYDEILRQYSRINGRLYEDEAFTLPTTVYFDVICNVINSEHILCNYYAVDETVGVFSLFSGVAKLDFSVSSPIGTGRFVYQGGSDLHAGILGRVSTIYKKDIIKHDFCVQGSTYDHIIPPMISRGPESDDSSSNGEAIDGSNSSNLQVVSPGPGIASPPNVDTGTSGSGFVSSISEGDVSSNGSFVSVDDLWNRSWSMFDMLIYNGCNAIIN